jgi:hypothetical protein
MALPSLGFLASETLGQRRKRNFQRIPVGIDSKEGLTEGDKIGDMQDRIRRELVKLHAINKKKPTKKFVGRKRKTTEEESKEHNPITARGLGDALSVGEDDRCHSNEEPLPLGLVQIGFLEFRGNPLGRRAAALLLRHLLLVRNLLCGHSEEMRSGAARELKSARKMKQWQRRKSRELVNSKNQGLPLTKLPVKGTWAETWCAKWKR